MDLWRRFGAYSVLGCLTLLSLLLLPALVGVLADDSAMNEAQAGWSATLNFGAGALAALLMSLRMHHLHLRYVALTGLLLAAACDALAACHTDAVTRLLVLRCLAGLGTGAAYTAVVGAFARLDEVERGFGLFITLQFIFSGLGLYVVPVFADVLGARGLLLSFAVLEIFAAGLCLVLPGPAEQRHAAATTAPQPAASEWRILTAGATLLAVLGFGLFEAANVAQFTYVERLGVWLQLSEHQIGLALLIGSLIGIPGAFSIVFVGKRLGRMGPLAAGIAAALVGLGLMITAEDYLRYFAGSCLLGFSWAFCLPFIQGLLASLDTHGSASAAGSAASTLGDASGPGLAALTLGGGGYDRVFILAIALFLVALACLQWSETHRAGTVRRAGAALAPMEDEA